MVALYLTALLIRPAILDDHLGFLDNGKIRLGVDLNLGGAITYLSKSDSDVNVVNSADWGRQIQMSHYSGPNLFAPHGKRPTKAWEGLGWNPIQVGDSFGNRSKLLAYRNDGKSIYVKCIPMQWPLNNEPGECTFECWFKLDGQAVQVRSRMLNARADHTQYEGRDQELPAVYTNGPWYRLMTYSGDKPFSGDKLSQQPPVFMWRGWQATENWAALVDDSNFGLGVWHPGAYSFIGGFAGKTGAGGPHDDPTGYIAPVLKEMIDWNVDYDYRYTLILGKLDEIRKYVYDRAKRPTPPNYDFGKGRQHWVYRRAVDQGWPIRGGIHVTANSSHAELIGPDGFWLASEAPKLTLDATFAEGTRGAIVFWKRFGEPSFLPGNSMKLPIVPDGKDHRIVLDLVESPEYRGAITGVGLDVESASTTDHAQFVIRRISFGR